MALCSKREEVTPAWIKLYKLKVYKGVERVVSGLEGMHLADRCILMKLELCRIFLPSPVHACPCRGSWATFVRLNHAWAKSEFPTLENWDLSAKGDNPNRKHGSSRIAGDEHGADNPIL
jgi:hypothetical protein